VPAVATAFAVLPLGLTSGSVVVVVVMYC
jgi:hypothetical protein